MKYKIGDYVSKPITGVCRVEDILRLDKIGIQNEKLYYLLIPVDDQNEKIYVPVGSAEEKIRACLTSEEAWKLIEQIPQISEIWIVNEKMKEQQYKEAIRTNRPEALVSVIKRIYQQKQRRREQGKKPPSSDERYFLQAKIFYTWNWGVPFKNQNRIFVRL